MAKGKNDQVLATIDAIAAVCILTWVLLFFLMARNPQPAQQSTTLRYFFVDSVFFVLAILWLVFRYAERFNRERANSAWFRSNRATIATVIVAGLLVDYIIFRVTGGR